MRGDETRFEIKIYIFLQLIILVAAPTLELDEFLILNREI